MQLDIHYFCSRMTNFIPIFPLAIVVYPGEHLNLHIFEPRYKQLINDCRTKTKPFGIPPVINNNVSELGTMLEILEVTKAYDSGELDIKTVGRKVFRTLEVIREVPEKLYSGAIVNYPGNSGRGSQTLMPKVVEGIRQLHKLLNIEKEFGRPDEELNSYDVAHHAGLSLEEEYEFLGLFNELQRQEYLKRHLVRVLPVVAEMETLKGKAKLNGHFKNLEGFQF